MATPLDYKPTHKKPHAYAGSTPRGPERWARAMHNAWRNPNSESAELFYKRLTWARQVQRSKRVAEGTFAMLQYDAGSSWPVETPPKWKVDYYCCSVHCMAMNAQLDIVGDPGYTMMVDILNGVTVTSYRKVERRQPTRTVRCQFCGSKVAP